MKIFKNIWEWISGYLNDIAKETDRQRKSKIRQQILRDLRYIRIEDNQGLIRRRLTGMKDVVYFRSETGWPNIVDVRMADGYEIRTRDSWMKVAIRKAGIEVALRLRKVYL